MDLSHKERAAQLRDVDKDLLALLHDLREGTDISLTVKKKESKAVRDLCAPQVNFPGSGQKILRLNTENGKSICELPHYSCL